MLTILKNKNTNKLITLGILLLLPLFVTACTLQDLPLIGSYFGKSGNTTSGNLTVWGVWQSPEVVDALINKYKETHPDVTITYEDRSVIPSIELKDRVFARADQSDTNVDIMFVHNSWVPRLRSKLTPAPESVLTADAFNQKFYSVASESAVFDKKVYGVPLYHEGLVLVYNKKHFEEVGQFEPPTAWEEFRRLALELTIKGKDDELIRSGAAIGTADNIDFFSDILGLMFSQAGIVLPDGITSRPAQDAFDYFVNFSREDGVWDSTMPEATTAFAQGKVSMIFVPTWIVTDIVKARPDMEIGVAFPPQIKSDQPVGWGTFWMGVVPSSSKNSALAWDFLNFLTQEDTQKAWFEESSKAMPYGAAYSLKSLKQDLATHPYLGPVLQTAEHSKSYEIAGRAGDRRQVTALQDAVNKVILKTISTEEALTAVKAELVK